MIKYGCSEVHGAPNIQHSLVREGEAVNHCLWGKEEWLSCASRTGERVITKLKAVDTSKQLCLHVKETLPVADGNGLIKGKYTANSLIH